MKPYYQDKWATIYHGDCRLILPELPKVDLVLTDPPYGTTACSWDTIIPLEQMWGGILGVTKDNTPIVFTASQPFTSRLVMSNLRMFKYEWIWEKHKGTNIFNAYKQPLKIHENIIVFYETQCKYNPQKIDGEDYRQRGSHNINIGGVIKKQAIGYSQKHEPSKRLPVSIQRFTNHNQKQGRFHPTQKPIGLFKYLINTYTNESDMVLDPFLGSGTTTLAAKLLNRKCIGIEIEEKYCEIAANRCRQMVMELKI